MQTIQVTSHVGSDGILAIRLPVEIKNADVQVTVRVDAIDQSDFTPDQREEWKRFVAATAGAWQGEPLERLDPGPYEQRDALE